ncbi:MAG: hypothetical protein LBP55_08510 [Candidatus Adiutrix sp.]|jgi:hypothetical protein|nr:hypothetical protein [Candidatus Adiutrix sp.]
MGGLFKTRAATPQPQADAAGLKAAQEEQRRVALEAQAAESRRAALAGEELRRKKQVARSGRAATILAGENDRLGQ